MDGIEVGAAEVFDPKLNLVVRKADAPAPTNVHDLLRREGMTYKRVRDLHELLGRMPADRCRDPDEHYAESPMQAWCRTQEICSDLFATLHHYERLGRDHGYELWTFSRHADLAKAYAAEKLTLIWMTRANGGARKLPEFQS
jgi:hypothetical protein